MTPRSFMASRELSTVAGRKWLLDRKQLIDASIFSGAWEPTTTKAIQGLVKPGMVVLDVGANIGWYTVILSELVGPTGKVISFEPMQEPAFLTQLHIYLNDLQNAVLHKIALDDRDWEEPSGFFNYAWPLTPPTDPIKQPKNGMLHRTLDGLQTELGLTHVDFIKIDVDGYEAKMLRGAQRILETFHPTMLLEVCEYTLRSALGKPYCKFPYPGYGEEVRLMLEGLEKLGYKFYREDTLQQVSISEVLSMTDLSIASANVVVKI